MNKYVVSWDGGIGSGASRQSEPLNSMEEADRYVLEELPYGVQKCRTGTYEILEGKVCSCCDEFYEIYKGVGKCENCVCPDCGHTPETGACFQCKLD